MDPARPARPLAHDEAVALRRLALRQRLHALGVEAAPEATPDDVRRVLDAGALIAQFVRASRSSSGAVRAFASLIADANEDDAHTVHWVARVERAAAELDDFAARMTTLRICRTERPTSVAWNDVLSRVAARGRDGGTCAIEVIDRSRGCFCQRGELLGRMLFHLVRNAVEASPRGACVRTRVDEYRQTGARLFHVRVADEGPGIDASVREDMWKPFVTSRRGHAGLGLACVAAGAPVVGAVVGMRREAHRTTAHMLVGEEGGLQW